MFSKGLFPRAVKKVSLCGNGLKMHLNLGLTIQKYRKYCVDDCLVNPSIMQRNEIPNEVKYKQKDHLIWDEF